MVSVRKLLLFVRELLDLSFVILTISQGVALVSAIPAPGPAVVERGVTVSSGYVSSTAEAAIPSIKGSDIEARVPGRMTLQWSPQGRIIFLLGMVSSVLDKFDLSASR
jgi:hypothetical protein